VEAKTTSQTQTVARSDQAAAQPEPKAIVKAEAKSDVKAEPKPGAKKVDVKPEPKAAKPEPKSDTKVESKPDVKTADKVRYIIQIGAFSDVPAAREVRMKAERAGLKTYTQVIGEGASKKIRVRLGPFEDKAAADKAMATLRKASLSGAMLTL